MPPNPTESSFTQHCERVMAACPVAACLIRFADGGVLKLNERFLLLGGFQQFPLDQLKTGRLELWSSGMDARRLKQAVREKHSLRGIEIQFRLLPDQRVVAAMGGLALVELDGQDCLLVFLEETGGARAVERSLAAARDAALESARMKSEFLANVSHEIRTPLNGIIGMTCLLRDTRLGSLQRNFTETIRLSADNLLNLINEILDFSKLEAGKLAIEKAPFDLASTVENTLDLLAERAHSKGLELTYLIDPKMPGQLIGDAGRIRQILTNLVNNAIKFTEKGEVSLKVTTRKSTGGEPLVHFDVCDTGIGIPQSALGSLFEAFHQVDSSTSRKYGGTGLGLAISRQLVEIMNGSIGVESTENEGSRFWFNVPQVLQEPAAPQPSVPQKLKTLRLLLVEDNNVNAANVLAVLKHHQISVDHVTSGQDALAVLRAGAREGRPFGLAIIDMDTHGMDGLTLSRAIKADQTIARTKILILTTVIHQVETAQLHASNIGACLTKPLKQSKLLDYLQAALSDHLIPRPHLGHLPDINSDLHFTPQPHGTTLRRILVAEDNSINQKVAKGLLARLGFAAEVVGDGRKLLRAMDLAPCDIVFMDCQLPEMDGFQATREIRLREQSANNGHRTYIIAMTADAVPGAREKCITSGMDDYLSKPIRLEELQTVLRRAVEFSSLSTNPAAKLKRGHIDPSIMDTLRMLHTPGQPDPLPQLIDEFTNAAMVRLEEIQAALVEKNYETIETAAHSLRGSAGGIGALRLAALSADLEESVRSGSFSRAAEVHSQMEEEFLCVKTALDFEKER